MKDPLLPALCEVQQSDSDTADVFTLVLTPPHQYGGFQAGQFNMLYIPGAGEAAISISGDPADGKHLVHTVRAVGSVTQLLRQQQAGARIGVRGPYGRGWPLQQARGKDVIIVAGGIGLAPLRPVIYALLNDREAYGKVSLFYGARSPEDLLYTRQLSQWREQGLLELFVSVDSMGEGWNGDVGVITELLPRARVDFKQSVAMVCGPEIMIRFTVNQLRELGMKREDVYVSLERNMKCALGYCGHCQLGPHFICKDGPVFDYAEVEGYLMAQGF